MSDTNPQTVTVDDAIKRGQWFIHYPRVFIFVAFVLLSLVIISVYDLSPYLIPVILLAGVF